MRFLRLKYAASPRERPTGFAGFPSYPVEEGLDARRPEEFGEAFNEAQGGAEQGFNPPPGRVVL